MFNNPVVKEILEKYVPVWSLGQADSLLNWDMEVYMPEGGTRHRGLAQANLSLMAQKMTLDLKPLLVRAEKQENLNDEERGVLRNLRRNVDYYEKMPPGLIEELQRASTEATVAWRSARKSSDFRSFEPHLEKLTRLKREQAEKLGYEKHPYDALLDRFEEGLTVEDVDAAFSKLIPRLKRILTKVMEDGRFSKEGPLESMPYDTDALGRVNEKVVELLGMPKERFRMDLSAHPFTTTISPDDVRITTRYEGRNFKGSTCAVVHECGHAIYNLQLGKDLAYTPSGHGASFAIHESQSRFWENAVGRSREFVRLVMPALKENLTFMSSFDEEAVYRYLNLVKPGYIRVEADELTYNFHIALRYDLEKRLLTGGVSVSDLPSVWDDTTEDLLGVRPRNDAEGVLQDIHWSHGSMGYFPSYSLGNIVVGVIWKSLGDGEKLRESVGRGDLAFLRRWLEQKVHRYGSTYAPKELLKRSFGEGYNPDRLVKYLEKKFLA